MPRPPKSAKLTLLEGNKSRYVKEELERRVANEDKLKMRSENIVPPSWLDATAKKEFKRLADLLLSVELISEADINHLALYCDAYSNFLSYKREIKAKGKWVDGKPNPFFAKMDKAAAQMRVFASDLGLSPTSRARLAIALKEEDEDDFF
ncbi:phage terminase small subunit P27 family [Heyndrickxia acidicola]|uniref:Phage terminase small subunit P27 family n=1 Tax=Heyndrickxia acidicola TaxID=209389 RepID=A0ABU6MPH9_9BACI|nr:phage terminase small subunit P27 family [Heyndrickxia acidicola]MED1205881.1 phage terminase small subunit P27 family [Heyndrickxia acidicola]